MFIATLALLPILALGLPGAVLALRARPQSWVIHAAIVVPTLGYAVLTAATRFRLPIDSLWMLLAAVTADRLLSRRRLFTTATTLSIPSPQALDSNWAIRCVSR